MTALFPKMKSRPESRAVAACLVYVTIGFLMLPFFVTFFALLLFPTEKGQCWLEIILHGVSFSICVYVFRDYLDDCFYDFQQDKKRFLLITGGGILACCAVWLNLVLFTPLENLRYFATFYSLPIAEKNMVIYPLNVLMTHPIPGLLCMTVLSPVAVSCLYYGVAFAPICNTKPWLGYILTTLMIALPRLAGCAMFRWDVEMELLTMIAQMPIHWICCFCYEQADNVWSPILIHALTNLLGSGAVLLLVSGAV